jgi:D-3-phosphoglycerate dehydrogenase
LRCLSCAAQSKSPPEAGIGFDVSVHPPMHFGIKEVEGKRKGAFQMGKFKVVIVDREYNNSDEESRILSEIDADLSAYHCKDTAEILEVAHDCDALIVHSAEITREAIEGLSRCKVIARYASGANGTDIEAATEHGILVVGAKDYGNEEVASHALALLLMLNRQLALFCREAHSCQWFTWYSEPPAVAQLSASVVGIIGFGRISRVLIGQLRHLCKEVWVYSRGATAEDIAACGAEKKSFEEITAGADYISIHCPLDSTTANLFDKEVFARMKKSAQIINMARGGVICETDLIEALKTGQIAGAALDVLTQEPPDPENPLLYMDNVIITPHAGWYSEASQRRLQAIVAEGVVAVLTGGRPAFCVNEVKTDDRSE